MTIWQYTKSYLAAIITGGFLALTIFMAGWWFHGAINQPLMDILIKNQCTQPALGRSVPPQSSIAPLPYYKVLADAASFHVPPKLPTRGKTK